MNDRLLTKEERDGVYETLPSAATCGDERRAFCVAQDAKTLRAVAHWLMAHKIGWWEDDSGNVVKLGRINVPDSALQAFLRGEMPHD